MSKAQLMFMISDRIQNSEIKPHIYCQLFFNKDTKIHNGEWIKVVLGKVNIHTQENKIRPLSYTTHRNQIKIQFKTETVKLLEENIGYKLLDIGLGNYDDHHHHYFKFDTKSKGNKNKQVELK